MNQKKLTLTLITIIYVLLMINFWNTVSADESYVAGQKILKRGEIQSAINQANKSIKKNPDEPRYYYGRAKILLTSTVILEGEKKAETKSQALKDLQRAENLNPRNLVTLRNTIPLYYFLAINDLEQTAAANNLDSKYLEVAQNYFEKLKENYPKDAGVQALVAKYENKLGLQESYQQTRENIEYLRPDLLEWYVK